jgi:hypothetical protein
VTFTQLSITFSNQRFSSCSLIMDVEFVKLTSHSFCGNGLEYSVLLSCHLCCSSAVMFRSNPPQYEVNRKVPGLGQKRNAGLTYSVLAAISFKVVTLGTYTAILWFFSTLQKQRGSHFPKCCRIPHTIPFGCQILFENVGRMGNDNHVVVSHYSQTGFQGCVGGRVIVMKEQCGACSNLLLRSLGKVYNRSQRCLRAHGLFGDGLRG